MDSKVINPKILRRSNKIKIMFKLLTEGDMSRIRLAQELGLTTASITQISRELISEGLIEERGNIQRNLTGRREILLGYNENAYGAVGVNIERDKIHISLCTYNRVIEEKIFITREFFIDGIKRLAQEINNVIADCPPMLNLLGVGIGIAGKVDENLGIAVDSHGILPPDYPLKEKLGELIDYEIGVINNVKAQARALIRSRDDNFMLIKHSPGIGSAVIVDGKAVEGYNGLAGELGHTIVERNGKLCNCGRRGCLETVVSESAIEETYKELSSNQKTVEEIYLEYGKGGDADVIIDNLIELLAIAIGNAAAITDPKLIMITGGLFFNDRIAEAFKNKFDQSGFGSVYKIKSIGNEKMIKAFAGARHMILKKLFEV
jgi:predicted NBD/HSP70 family sugar kinase/predicted transcriptional regulator